MHVKFVVLALWILCLEAVTTKETFAKYPHRYFIETGCFQGDGIQKAIDAGFEKIYSIELSPLYFQHCCKRFADNQNVEIFLGDSSTTLAHVLSKVDEPVTLWLDGHYSWGLTARAAKNSPILAELEAIKNHPIKTHTILIDDVRQFGTVEFDFIELEKIVQKILEINPNYQITFDEGAIENDVLVAQVPHVF